MINRGIAKSESVRLARNRGLFASRFFIHGGGDELGKGAARETRKNEKLREAREQPSSAVPKAGANQSFEEGLVAVRCWYR